MPHAWSALIDSAATRSLITRRFCSDMQLMASSEITPDSFPDTRLLVTGGLSLIVPCHNEEAMVDVFFDRVLRVLGGLAIPYEIVCIDDGSTDSTLTRLLALRQRDPSIKIISLSRDFGKDAAVTAGIDHCRGGAVITIDADLQDPPELIPGLVAKWRDGFEVVYAQRRSREGDSWGRRFGARLFYGLMNAVADVRIPRDTGDFCLIDRKVVTSLRKLRERKRFMKGLIAWAGFRRAMVPYDRPPRAAGSSKWNYPRLCRFARDGIISFSSFPLRLAEITGIVIFVAGVLDLLWASRSQAATSSLVAVGLLISGLQLIALGVIGEYLAGIYDDVKRRPMYLISARWGFDDGRTKT